MNPEESNSIQLVLSFPSDVMSFLVLGTTFVFEPITPYVDESRSQGREGEARARVVNIVTTSDELTA